YPFSVAQVSNLLYRRFSASAARQSAAAARRRPIGRASRQPARLDRRATSGLQIRDIPTGREKSALPVGNRPLNTYETVGYYQTSFQGSSTMGPLRCALEKFLSTNLPPYEAPTDYDS